MAGTFQCLYNRRSRRAEAQEWISSVKAFPPASDIVKRDVWWRAAAVVGRGVARGGDVTLMFGADGKITSESGCNNYFVNYQLTSATLAVFTPIISTRMMCPPSVMGEEADFWKALGEAVGAAVPPDGALEPCQAQFTSG